MNPSGPTALDDATKATVFISRADRKGLLSTAGLGRPEIHPEASVPGRSHGTGPGAEVCQAPHFWAWITS